MTFSHKSEKVAANGDMTQEPPLGGEIENRNWCQKLNAHSGRGCCKIEHYVDKNRPRQEDALPHGRRPQL